MRCVFFNPMYLNYKCPKCQIYKPAICGNQHCGVCLVCHPRPSIWDHLRLWLFRKANGL
jgi:hypothetical protein